MDEAERASIVERGQVVTGPSECIRQKSNLINVGLQWSKPATSEPQTMVVMRDRNLTGKLESVSRGAYGYAESESQVKSVG